MNIHTENIKKLILLVFITGVLIWGNFITVNYLNFDYRFTEKWLILCVLCLFLFMFVFSLNIKISKKKVIFYLIWQILIGSIFISKVIFQNFFILEYILYSIIIPLTLYSVKIKSYKSMLLVSSVISILPLILIFNNTNSMGIIFCFAGISLLNLIEIKKYSDKYLYISILFFNILIYFTESRTSVISFLIISLLYLFNRLKNEKKNYFSFLTKSAKIIIVTLIFYYSYDYINNLIFKKYDNSEFDLLSSRGEIWSNLFNNDLRFWGSGEVYFLINSGFGDAHNTFFQVLGSYGMLSFILFIFLYIFIVYKSWRIFRENADITYLGFFGLFFLLSLTENLFFIESRMIHSSILFFLYLGFLINESSLEKSSEKRTNI